MREALRALQTAGRDIKTLAHLLAEDVQNDANRAYQRTRSGTGLPSAAEAWGDMLDTHHRSFADLSAAVLLPALHALAQASQPTTADTPDREDAKIATASHRKASRTEAQPTLPERAEARPKRPGRANKLKDS